MTEINACSARHEIQKQLLGNQHEKWEFMPVQTAKRVARGPFVTAVKKMGGGEDGSRGLF